MRLRGLMLLLLPLAASGCVAAVIPVAMGGAMTRSTVKGRARPHQREAKPIEQAAPASVQVPAAPPPALPADPTLVRPGQFYSGNLPPPGPTAAPANAGSPVAAPSAKPPPAAQAGWSDVGHFVAANLSPPHSLLLARGSDAADPHWLSCRGKPPALLAAAGAVLAPGDSAPRAVAADAQSWIDALRVMGVTTVLVAADANEADAAKLAFAKAGLSALVQGDTLMIAGTAAERLAARARIGAAYCVVALVGRSPADFPNGLAPDATPPLLAPLWGNGWFLLAGPAR